MGFHLRCGSLKLSAVAWLLPFALLSFGCLPVHNDPVVLCDPETKGSVDTAFLFRTKWLRAESKEGLYFIKKDSLRGSLLVFSCFSGNDVCKNAYADSVYTYEIESDSNPLRMTISEYGFLTDEFTVTKIIKDELSYTMKDGCTHTYSPTRKNFIDSSEGSKISFQ